MTLAIFNGYLEIAKDLWLSGARIIRPQDKEGDSSNLVHTVTYKGNLAKLEEKVKKETGTLTEGT